MDLMMPEMDGVAATAAIRKQCPAVQVIALTSFREEGLVQRALQAGAISYLLKNVSADELVEAIRAARTGRSTLAPEATQDLIASALTPPIAMTELTPREREVLTLMAQGLNNTAIAERLIVSRSTVKAHVSHILAKLDAGSRTEAVAIALQRRLLP
jgi:NarL family two-component system response regulator LiaR